MRVYTLEIGSRVLRLRTRMGWETEFIVRRKHGLTRLDPISNKCTRVPAPSAKPLPCDDCEMRKPDWPRTEMYLHRFPSVRLSTIIWLGFLLGGMALEAGDAWAEQKSKFTVLRIVSPDAREIAIPDKAKLNDVLKVLMENGITFDGPEPIILKGVGEPQTLGHRLEIRLNTYNPRGVTDPDCPYQQITELRYDLEGRLYEYTVFYFVSCVK